MSQRKRLQQTYDKVRILSLATPRARKQLIQSGDQQLINCVSECCQNILEGKVPLSPETKQKLAKHKTSIRTVAKKKTSLKKKKDIIQKGGFLGLVLPAVAGFLGSMLLNRQ